MAPAYVQYLNLGKASAPLPSLAEIRKRVIAEVDRASLES